MALSIENVREAVSRLSQTERGRSAMRHILGWLDDSGLSLDGRNQSAALVILYAAWGPFPGTVRDLMRDSLEDLSCQAICEHGVVDGDWCEDCNRDYKEASNAEENQKA